MDVKNCFSDVGDLQEEVFVSQPEDLKTRENPITSMSEKGSFYGLKQAPRAWYDHNTLKVLVATISSKRRAPNFRWSMMDRCRISWTTSSQKSRGIFIKTKQNMLSVTLKEIWNGLSDPVVYPTGGSIKTGNEVSFGVQLTKLDLGGMVELPNVPYSP
ncbi:retrovirus-related pol polyprotein from transposon TNT 1-94 [Tanacetum coccineum]